MRGAENLDPTRGAGSPGPGNGRMCELAEPVGLARQLLATEVLGNRSRGLCGVECRPGAHGFLATKNLLPTPIEEAATIGSL